MGERAHPNATQLPRLFVYPRLPGSTCGTYGNWNNHQWEVTALDLIKQLLPRTDNPDQADLFLVDECMQHDYFSRRTSKHRCQHCVDRDAKLMAGFRRVGHHYDLAPHRHIVTHVECPRRGKADPLDVLFPSESFAGLRAVEPSRDTR